MLNKVQLNDIGFNYVSGLTEPLSPYGADLKRRVKFYAPGEHSALLNELQNVEKLCKLLDTDKEAFLKAERALMQFRDIRFSLKRSREAVLTDVELFEIKRFLMRLDALAEAYHELCGEEGLHGIDIRSFPGAMDIIDPDGMRAMSFRISSSGSERIAAVRKERRQVDILLRKARGEEAEKLTVRRTFLAAEEENEEARLRALMTEDFKPYAGEIEKVTESIAGFDFALAKARLMKRLHGIIPKVPAEGGKLRVKGMRNPAVSKTLEERGREFKPIDIELDRGASVITGANMGGKSIALKTLALNVRLALSGYPVFCHEAEIPHFFGLHLLCGEQETGGLSSFGGEMVRFNKILEEQKAEGLSLVLLDEFARGTNPYEGAALVRAAVRYFNEDGRAIALIATHFDGIAPYAAAHYQVMGLKKADLAKLNSALSGGAENTVSALEEFMDYGLYRAAKAVNPPRDAFTICRALRVSGDFMKFTES